jgi:hypothetical protein
MADEENAKPKSRGGIKRFLVTLIIIGAILVATAFLVVRTDGGRSFVEKWLVKQLDMDLTIKDAKLELPFTLVIIDAVSKAVEPGGKPLLRIRELSVSPTMRGGLKLDVRRGVLFMLRNASGDWTPAFFSKFGEMPSKNVAEISRVMRKMGKGTSLFVNDSAITWIGEDGVVKAEVTGLSFDAAPVDLPDRTIRYFRVAADSAKSAAGVVVKDVEREWLCSDTKDYVELNRIGGSREDGGSAFWEAGGKPGAARVEDDVFPNPKDSKSDQLIIDSIQHKNGGKTVGAAGDTLLKSE